MSEPKIPEVRDDDAEEVADKLSIATAMWARGDRADALSWLRRAAESASDAELDMRALELAKAASELSALVDSPSVAAQAAAPAAQPASPAAPPMQAASATPARPPTTAPGKAPSMPGRAPAAASTLPKKASPSRPPGGRLPPLPPMRPLGSAPAPAPRAPSTRVNSIVSSVPGATPGYASSSGIINRDDHEPPPAADPSKPMPWDEPMRGDEEDEATHQIALPDDPREPLDMDSTATREIAVMSHQVAREDIAPISTREAEPEPPPSQAELPLAIGIRVRLVQDASGVRVYPEGQGADGVAAILVPLDGGDLRAMFQRRA